MCDLTRCCTVFMKKKTLVFEDPKPQPDFEGSKRDMSLLQKSWAHFHMETQHLSFALIWIPPRTEPGSSHGRILQDRSLQALKYRRPLWIIIQGHITGLLSALHCAVWINSSFLPRNWADRVVLSLYIQLLKQWSNWLGLEAIQGLESQASRDRAGNRPEYKLQCTSKRSIKERSYP